MFISTQLLHCIACFRSRSGYDSTSGGDSDNEYNPSLNQENQVQSQAQNQVQNQISTTSHNQGKHINKGRWTKEEVRAIAI